MSQPDVLAERYGAPPAWRGRLVLGLVTIAAVALAALLGWAAWTHATPEARSEVVGFSVVDEHTVEATVEVRLSSRASDVQCVLRALAEDKTAVGEVTFSPEDSGRVAVTIRTERRATSVEKVGCTADGQKRPS